MEREGAEGVMGGRGGGGVAMSTGTTSFPAIHTQDVHSYINTDLDSADSTPMPDPEHETNTQNACPICPQTV